MRSCPTCDVQWAGGPGSACWSCGSTASEPSWGIGVRRVCTRPDLLVRGDGIEPPTRAV